MKKLNLVGRRVAQLRYERDMTQDELADALERIGWSMTRSGVSKLRKATATYVPDFRLLSYLRRRSRSNHRSAPEHLICWRPFTRRSCASFGTKSAGSCLN